MNEFVSNTPLVERILGAMRGEIERYKLELLQRYPDDLNVHDAIILGRNALPGAKLAWMVGDSHTHIVALGLHPEMNEYVTCFTRMCNNDRFYVLDISGFDSFKMKELKREEFTSLIHTPVPYRSSGDMGAFSLYRNGTCVGTCAIEYRGVGQGNRQQFHATLTPIAGCTERDKLALEHWACINTNKRSGTLLRDLSFKWEKAIELAAAA